MRTLLIMPSFMLALTIAILAIGWLIVAGGEGTGPASDANLPREAFTSWAETFSMGKPAMLEATDPTTHEHFDEVGSF
ncbi:MAG: hypothetical protein Kow0032_21750 [Methyloligellaceae bacterium]